MHVMTLDSTIETAVAVQPVAPPAPETPHWVDHVVARVHGRHPTATEALVRRCVQEAADRFDDVGVDLYLPILVERRSSLAVKAALIAFAGRPPDVG